MGRHDSPARRVPSGVGGLKRDRSTIGSYLENARTPIPVGVAERVAAPIVAAAVFGNKAGDDDVRADLAELPRLLDRVD